MLTKRFQEHIATNFPELTKTNLYLAISGGMDSIVLGELMHALGFDFEVLHVNFKLRGRESDEDENFVRKWAEEKKHNFRVKHFNTTEYAKKTKMSIQMAARELRYAWFEELPEGKVLLAHHQNDLVETFMINLSRGSGIKGLIGMPAKRDRYLRPLLVFSREDIEKFAINMNVRWREDSSNRDTKYLRNYMRHEVLDGLNSFVPQFASSVAQSSQYLSEVWTYLNQQSEHFRQKHVQKQEDGIKIDLKGFDLKYKVLMEMELKQYGFNATQINNIFDGIENSGLQFEGTQYTCTVSRGVLLVGKIGIQDKDFSEVSFLLEPGVYSTDWGGFKVSVHNQWVWEDVRSSKPESVYLSDDALCKRVEVRLWKQGDKMVPLGMKGAKKLSDIFIDQKINIQKKKTSPVMLIEEKILWLVGLKQSELYKVKKESKGLIRIDYLH